MSGRFMRGRGPLGQGVPASPVRRSKMRKRWVRRVVRTLLVACGLTGGAVLVHAGWDFLHSDGAFGIRQIHVVGLSRHEPQALRDRLADLRGRNLFGLQPADVYRRISDFAWLKGFLCRKHLPDTLIVEVVERTQLCSLSTDQGVFEIDGQGVCWPALPGVPGVFRLERGLYVGDPQVQALVAELLRSGLAPSVRSIGPGPSPGTCTLTTPEGWQLVVNGEDLQGQWQRFQAARAWVATYTPDRRGLDCRWPGKVVLLPPPPAKDSDQSPTNAVEGGRQDG